MNESTTKIAMRVPTELLAQVDDLAARIEGTRTDALRLLLIAGIQMEEARRSWRDQGDAIQAVRDFADRAEDDPITPENARGQWDFEAHWAYGPDGERRMVLEAKVPTWWGLLVQPPTVPGDEAGGPG